MKLRLAMICSLAALVVGLVFGCVGSAFNNGTGASGPGGGACASGQMQCGGTCIDTHMDDSNCGTCGKQCSSGRSCVRGDCDCSASATDCGGKCVDTSSDPQHCGGCNTVCSGACLSGQCSTMCTGAGFTMCGS